MKRHSREYTLVNKIKANSKFNRGLRIICAILCITFLLGSCVACESYVSTDDVSELQGSLNNALNEIAAINAKYEATLEELASVNVAYEATLQELALLKNSYEDMKANLEELKVENENIKGAFESSDQALKEAYTSANQKIDRLEENLKSAQALIDSLKGTVNASQDEIISLKQSYDAAQQEIESLKAQIEELKNKLPNEEEETEKIKIYIDQGHNPTSYHNSGAVGNGLYEQDLTFTIGILLAELLEEDGRFEICLSRPTANTVLGTDNDSSLDARVAGATNFGADYFISLHINSYDKDTANGIEVYVAEQESESYAFGSSLLQGLIDSTALKNRGMKLDSSLRVLKNATMPAALVEMGFISNVADATLLDNHPELFAEGLYDGILSYFDLEPIDTSTN